LNKDLAKTKEQLVIELEAANNQLQENEQILKRHKNDLRERVKELNCLHEITEIFNTKKIVTIQHNPGDCPNCSYLPS